MNLTEQKTETPIESWSADTVHEESAEASGIALIRADELSRILRKRWLTVVAAAIVVTAIAAGLSSMQPRRYRASAIAAVVTVGDHISTDETYRGVEVLEQRTVIATVAALAAVPSTTQLVEAQQPARRAHYDIAAIVIPNTSLLRIDVEGTDPSLDTLIANRAIPALDAQARAMYHLYGVRAVSPATIPTVAISPRVSRAVAAGLVVGLILGVGLALTVETLSRASRS